MKAPNKSASRQKQHAAAKSRPTEPPTLSKKKILLADDHPMMRAGMAQLINKQPELEVSCEAADPAAAFRELAEFKVDLVVTDLAMPGRSGIEFIKDLLAAHPTLPILVNSMHDELMYAERVVRAGARGYIMKEAGGENLLTAIRHVLSGQVYLSPKMSAVILEKLSARKPRGSQSPIEKLSDREFEVFQLIGRGKSTRHIAEQLHLSPKTVDVHRSRLKEKLQLPDATALVRHAVRWLESQNSGA